MTISCQSDDGGIIARSSQWPDAVKLVVATPDMGLHTSHARQVLPDAIPLADAIFNLQRALLFVDALRRGTLLRPSRGHEGSLASAGARGARARPDAGHRV